MRPKLLDLYCGAGGSAAGYERAGFDVFGVDVEPQPRYPFPFVQADAIEFMQFPMIGFDAIHASPPCQAYSQGAKRWRTTENHSRLISATRTCLEATGLPFVIENIEGARDELLDPTMLCGTMFDLGVFRHRLFETGGRWTLTTPVHERHQGRIGDGKYVTVTGHAGGSSSRDGWTNGSTEDWRVAMGIDWMSGRELVEAIPPAYTEYVGGQLLVAVTPISYGEEVAA